MRQDALTRLRAAMQQADAEVMLIDHGEMLAWLTGYTVSETLYRACLVPLSGEPWMVLRQLDEVPCRTQSPGLAVVSYPDWADPWQTVADSLTQRGFATAKVGADFYSYGMTVHSWQQLSRHLPGVVWRDLTGISDRLRSVKSASELNTLRHAAAIADFTLQQIGSAVTAGWRVRDVAALAARHFLEQGADSGETGPIVIASGDSGFLHASSHEQRLQRGDILHVELIPKVNHYSARVMRPFVVGKVSDAQQVLAQQLLAIQDRQIAAMKPGMLANEVDALAREALLSSALRSAFTNVTGYTLGLYTRTPRPSDFSGAFHPGACWQLEADMVFHMYLSAQGMAFSETVRVTAAGGERLTRVARQPGELAAS